LSQSDVPQNGRIPLKNKLKPKDKLNLNINRQEYLPKTTNAAVSITNRDLKTKIPNDNDEDTYNPTTAAETN